ncbi:MAG: PAS domain S-box protein [Pirellulales bacterium]|nr:PAS domain S-box protein [Pirellulales bacterium]
MKTILVALPPDWEKRLCMILARRGHSPLILNHLDGEEEILHNDESVLAVLSADGSAAEALRISRRLRDRQPTPKLQILLCVSAPPGKEGWPAYQSAGVDFFLPEAFTDDELAFRIAVAEFTALSSSPTGDISPPPGRKIDFSPDTENVPYGVFISTLDHRFLKVNDGLVQILGYSSKEELLQVDIARDIYLDARERAWLLASVPPHNKTLEVVWRRRDGTPVTLQLSGRYVLDEATRSVHLQGTAWDVTELRRNEELLRMQRDLGIALSRYDNLRQTLDIVLDTAIRIEGIDSGAFYLVEQDTNVHRLVASRNLSPEFVAAVASFPGELPELQPCYRGKPFYVREEGFNPRHAELARSEGIRCAIILPILQEGRLLATLILSSHDREEFSSSARLAVETIAMQIGDCIARALAEDALRASRSNLQTLFDALDDMVLVVDLGGKILHHNPAVEKRLGYRGEELREMSVVDLHPPDRQREVIETLARLLEGKQAVCIIPFRTKRGEPIPVETRVVRGVWGGKEVGFGVARDRSEREAARRALEQSEARFRAIFENASVGIGLSDMEGRILDVNVALAKMEGRTREELIGRHFLDFTTSEDGETQARLLEDVREGRRRSFDLEKRYYHADGTPFWVHNYSSIVPAPSGEKPQYLISVVEYIDARKRAEESLRESERRYRLLAENASDVVWSASWTPPDLSGGLPADADTRTVLEILLRGWRFEYVSPSLEKVLGYGVEESMSDTPITRMDPAWHPAIAKILLDNLKELVPSQTFEIPMLAKDGAQRWCEVTVNVLPTAPGEPLQIMGIMRDITSRHDAQEALRKSEAQLRGLFENLPDSMVILDRSGRILFTNHGAPGIDAESLIGADSFAYVAEIHREAAREALAGAWSGRARSSVELADLFGNSWACLFVPMFEAGAVYQVMAICTDVTEKKKNAQAILDEQKLLRRLIDLQERERRFLSYEIHDGFAQQITGALFHLDAFNRLRGSDDSQAEKNLERTAAMLRRSIDETRRLISGLRPPILDESGILAAIEYLVCEHRERSGIDIMFVHDLRAIRLAPPLESAVFRIVQESLTNACRHSGSDFIRVELNRADERLEIVVFDEGAGFDPAAVPEDRFGLRSIRERARLLGGEADIQSAPGDGCRIRAFLPLVLAEMG